jgi:uncharacterized protein YbjT (DUF2867 family)
MTVLVTGSTGTIGSQVVQRLAGQSVRIRALVRDDASKVKVPAGVEPVQGDMTDVVSMRAALEGVDTLFLLNAAASGEVTQALLTLDLAREAGVQRIVYFSVFNSALFDDVPHFASKHLAERVIDAQALPATVLRPAAFMQNDLMLRDALKAGVYPQSLVARIGRLAARRGRYRRAGPSLTPDSHRAIQSEPRSPSSHPEAAAQSDELGGL